MMPDATQSLGQPGPAPMREVPIGKATVNKIGPGWEQALGKAEAVGDNNRTHPPLYSPGFGGIAAIVHQPSPPAPPAPTEEELRAALTQAVAAWKEALSAANAAEAALLRARELVEQRKTEMAAFANFDQEMAQRTIEALRDGGNAEPRVGPQARPQYYGARRGTRGNKRSCPNVDECFQ